MRRRELTERQREVLDFIKEKIRENGYPPTIREIGERFGISEKGAYDHLRALERKGYIRRRPRKTRAIEVLEPMEEEGDVIRVPIVGRIAAGEPLFAQENLEGELPLPRELFGDGELFALRVRGESMVEDGIFDGDYVIVRRQSHAEPGDIVVALIGDEATIKRFYRERGRIKLVPANSSMKAIYVTEAQIQGKVIGVIRKL
ncbi:repressor LexA [Candidatus Poribacteria bacterium]|nr:MAG: repressor LexA [Candidatus Poribacteria bacterium]